jgi:hypothetical protein
MNDRNNQSWPADRIQRRLRRDEALIEMVCSERVFIASREHPNIPAKPEAIRRLVELGSR